MKTPEPLAAEPDRTNHDVQTSLPLFSTWPRVYWLVAASFILWVVLLLALEKSFS